MGLFGGGNKMPVDGKTILITGGSEGLGLCAAKLFAAKGANIIIVSRSTAKLEAAVKEIHACAKHPEKQRFHHIAANVATLSYATAVIEEATAWNGGDSPDIVWTCAGFSRPQLFMDMEMRSLRDHMDVNFYGTAEMAHAILREWLAPTRPIEDQPRHLIMTVSVVTFYAVTGYAPYTPSKCAIRGLADTLAHELTLYPQNVQIHVACPGTILSPGFEIEEKCKPEVTKLIEAKDPRETPEQVAEAVVKGLEKGLYYIPVNFNGFIMKCGSLGGTLRDSWIMDTIGAFLNILIYMFVIPDMLGQLKGYAKKHGHPSTFKKET